MVLYSTLCTSCRSRLEVNSQRMHNRMTCPECEATLDAPRRAVRELDTVGGFKLKRMLGKGGMGEVYLAIQESMDRDVALKILPASMTNNKKLVDRFINEVRLSARLDHPNIVRAYDAGDDDGVYYMALAYVEGRSLEELLQQGGALTEGEALRIASEIGSALAFSWNEHHMLHRDIKPDNIMIDVDGRPRLLDMGLSKCLDEAEDHTVVDMIIGTPNYMSPEQASGHREIDTRADMYALGTTLYHMVTGRRPFDGEKVTDILRKQAAESLPDPRAYVATISEGLVRVLQKLLAKSPDDRYPDWDALLSDFDRVAKGMPPKTDALTGGEASVLLVGPEKAQPPVRTISRRPAPKRPAGKPHANVAADKGASWAPLAMIFGGLVFFVGGVALLIASSRLEHRLEAPGVGAESRAQAVTALHEAVFRTLQTEGEAAALAKVDRYAGPMADALVLERKVLRQRILNGPPK